MKQLVYPYRIAVKVFLLIGLTLSITWCKKEESKWLWCTDCQKIDILGNYEGTANHLKYINDTTYTETKDKAAYAELTDREGQLKVSAGILNLFNVEVSGSFGTQYYIEIPGSASAFSAIIWKKENEIKLVGTAKKLDSNGNLRELIDFELLKKED